VVLGIGWSMRWVAASGMWVSICLAAWSACAQDGIYRKEVLVQAETRLDWVPAELARGDRPGAQTYELFEPAGAIGEVRPLVIFVSPQDRPAGWSYWEATCREHGVLFAGLRGMGNGQPMEQRVRAVLGVLDDLRRRFRIDPDRTYLAGFSGGAYVACRTAFHLPEYFGGVVCIGDSPELPEEPWLIERVRQRVDCLWRAETGGRAGGEVSGAVVEGRRHSR
jgi:pimeloyl-ACP methyl ester carboxylesterase